MQYRLPELWNLLRRRSLGAGPGRADRAMRPLPGNLARACRRHGAGRRPGRGRRRDRLGPAGRPGAGRDAGPRRQTPEREVPQIESPPLAQDSVSRARTGPCAGRAMRLPSRPAPGRRSGLPEFAFGSGSGQRPELQPADGDRRDGGAGRWRSSSGATTWCGCCRRPRPSFSSRALASICAIWPSRTSGSPPRR